MSLVNAQFDPAAKLPVIRVALPEPRIGSKIYLIEEKGVYVFEEGPSVLRSLACTHIGAGSNWALTRLNGLSSFAACPPDARAAWCSADPACAGRCLSLRYTHPRRGSWYPSSVHRPVRPPRRR